ncbi:MAG: hypothetical protein JW892_01455 [Anaerolineae bacterium]|nr:hypothetical protein [Anaerolineae bacterium]
MSKRIHAESLIQQDSTDHRYFMVTQQVVWYECSDPFQFTLWSVVKMVAGDSGTCRISTPKLADLAMMSTGKVSECRAQLITKRLLSGYQDAETGLWHLSIPDLWERNIAWRQATGDSLTERATLKRRQRETSRAQRREMATEATSNADPLSPYEPPTLSPHESPVSPGESPVSPHESPPSPGETKNILFADPVKKNQEGDATAPAPAEVPIPAQHPAVVAHTRLTGVRLRPAICELLAASIPSETTALEIWEAVLVWWLAQDYNPRNLSNLLEVWEQVSSYPGETAEVALLQWREARERNNGRGTFYAGPSITSEPVVRPAQPRTTTADERLWQATLEDLELQLTAPVFNSWLRGSHCIGHQDDGTLLVQVCSELGLDWLRGRLYPIISKSLEWTAGRPLQVAFVAAASASINSIPEASI